MTHSLLDVFASFYTREETYHPPVRLDKSMQDKYLANTEADTEAANSFKLFNDRDLSSLFSRWNKFDLQKVLSHNKTFKEKGYSLLGNIQFPHGAFRMNAIYYNTVTHPDFPSYTLSFNTPDDNPTSSFPLTNSFQERVFPSREDSILQLFMDEKLTETAKKIQFHITIPRKQLLRRPDGAGHAHNPELRYALLTEKVPTFSKKETLEEISHLQKNEQIQLAQKMILLIKRTGFAAASFSHIRIHSETRKLVFLNTKPHGSLVLQKGNEERSPHSIAKCGRIGLHTLLKETESDPKLIHFHQTIKDAYHRAGKHLFEGKKIALSICLPLIPLVLLIYSLFLKLKIHSLYNEMRAKKIGTVEYADAQYRYYAAIEGIPSF